MNSEKYMLYINFIHNYLYRDIILHGVTNQQLHLSFSSIKDYTLPLIHSAHLRTADVKLRFQRAN